MAAKQLSAAGLQVLILEARNRIGGRVFTFNTENESFEGGAEFIHGNLALTLSLLEEARLQKKLLQGDVWQIKDGKWTQESDFFDHAEIVINQLKKLKDDINIEEFMKTFFAEEKYAKLTKALTSYVEGYYSGEVHKISAKSFLEEWMSEDHQQYRPTGGYGFLLHYLESSCVNNGGQCKLSKVVKEIRWSKGAVEVSTEEGEKYTAAKVLITVPLGVWTASAGEQGSIQFFPALTEKMEAAKRMGFGSVIKVLLKFDHAFWEDKLVKERCGVDTANFHMAISDLPIPTWWSQLPAHSALLTGWLSGPKAAEIMNETDENILDHALFSVSTIFKMNAQLLREQLKWHKIFNWTKDPFTRGSYSYSTLFTKEARTLCTSPAENTLFFAGEALYDGPEMGTVEAALTSGKQVAEDIIRHYEKPQ